MASRTPLGKRILRNLGKKWLQVIFSVVVFAIALSVSHRLLVKKATTDVEKKKEEAGFKFLHCDKCMKEMPYNKDLANKPAMACKCKQGDSGYWTATAASVANGQNPLRYYYTSILVESLVWLGSLYYLLARKDSAPQFYFHKCLHCRDMLRYTKAGFDLLVVCPSCGLYLRLPTDDEALTADDHNDEHTELVMKHFAMKLKETGYQFPEERQVAEHESDEAARTS